MSDDSTRNEQADGADTPAADDHADAIERQPVVAADDQGQSVSEPEPEPEPEAPPKTTLSMTIDDRPYEANPNQLVIDACELAGAYVPRFCYHPRCGRSACAASASSKSKVLAAR